jgi:hypothetical protein
MVDKLPWGKTIAAFDPALWRDECLMLLLEGIRPIVSKVKCPPRWFLVGNIRHNTKHFSTGTKVYCFPAMWGDGYENIKVIGKHKGGRFITIIIGSKHIHNWRAKLVHKPGVLKRLDYDDPWVSRSRVQDYVLFLNARG